MAESKRELYARAQRRLMGAMLADSESVTRVLELVNQDDIEEPAYSLMFASIAELSRRNEVIAPLSVAEHLQKLGELKKAGGIGAIYTLSREGQRFRDDGTPELYARVVKESSAKSKISAALSEKIKDFTDDSGVQAADAVAELQAALNDELLSLSDDATITHLNKQFADYSDALQERKRITDENEGQSEGLTGIPTLLPQINKYTRGWSPGQLITVGAGTGVGKSIFAVNCAVAAAQANNSVMFFSLEMDKTEIHDRIFSSTTGIPLNKLKTGTLDDDEKKRLAAQMEDMKEMKITLDVEPKQTVDSIRARAMRQAQSPDGLDFIIVDYLQLISSTGRHGSRQEAVAEISRNMKLLAKQLGIPIMVLVQMKRKQGDEDDSSLPKMDDIRESGAIAQDSDVVILLHRDLALDDSTPHTLVILAKNRGGEANKTVRCHSNLSCSLFREVPRVKDVEKLMEDDDDLADPMGDAYGDPDLADLDEYGGAFDTDDIDDFDFGMDD